MGFQNLLPVFLFLSVGAVSLFSFIAVAVWSEARLRERKAYYKSEMLKKLAENQGSGAASVLEILRDEVRNSERLRREGIRMGGLITVAVGIALLVFLRQVVLDRPVYLCGLIPLFIGVALLVYSYVLAPKQ
jgi:hypothetical protein